VVVKPPKPSLDVNLNTKIRVIVSGPQRVTSPDGNVEIITGEQAKEEAVRLTKGEPLRLAQKREEDKIKAKEKKGKKEKQEKPK